MREKDKASHFRWVLNTFWMLAVLSTGCTMLAKLNKLRIKRELFALLSWSSRCSIVVWSHLGRVYFNRTSTSKSGQVNIFWLQQQENLCSKNRKTFSLDLIYAVSIFMTDISCFDLYLPKQAYSNCYDYFHWWWIIIVRYQFIITISIYYKLVLLPDTLKQVEGKSWIGPWSFYGLFVF